MFIITTISCIFGFFVFGTSLACLEVVTIVERASKELDEHINNCLITSNLSSIQKQ
jgi:hypothetical protein